MFSLHETNTDIGFERVMPVDLPMPMTNRGRSLIDQKVIRTADDKT